MESRANMMVSILVLSTIAIVIPFICAESSTGGSPAQQLPKKLRVLGPSASRLYRVLHTGGLNNNGGEEDDFLIEDDPYVQKRQYDDYGHMRFGKRQSKGDFDDYGHLRFGRK